MMFSLPFCVALALKNRRCSLADFTVEALIDPEMMDRVTLVKDEGLDQLHPARWPTILEITTRAGRIYSGRTDFPRGDPENPVSDYELLAKFRALAEGPWGEKKGKGFGESGYGAGKGKQSEALCLNHTC